MMNGIDTIIQRLNTDAKAETDALLEKARQEAAAVAARYQAQADKEVADLLPGTSVWRRSGRNVSSAPPDGGPENGPGCQASGHGGDLRQALEKLRNLPEAVT